MPSFQNVATKNSPVLLCCATVVIALCSKCSESMSDSAQILGGIKSLVDLDSLRVWAHHSNYRDENSSVSLISLCSFRLAKAGILLVVSQSATWAVFCNLIKAAKLCVWFNQMFLQLCCQYDKWKQNSGYPYLAQGTKRENWKSHVGLSFARHLSSTGCTQRLPMFRWRWMNMSRLNTWTKPVWCPLTQQQRKEHTVHGCCTLLAGSSSYAYYIWCKTSVEPILFKWNEDVLGFSLVLLRGLMRAVLEHHSYRTVAVRQQLSCHSCSKNEHMGRGSIFCFLRWFFKNS